jgi:capsular polysaccharide biosynthesis protein
MRKEMPRYFFDVKNGHRLVDPSGIDCRNDREAKAQAAEIAKQIAIDVPSSAGVRHVAILDSERKEVGKVPVHPNGG